MLTMAQKRKRNAILSAVIGWILSLIILVPFAVIVVNSFKTTRDSAMMNLEWPRDGWVLSNYAEVLNGRQIVRSFFNSLLIASGCVLVCVVVTAMAMFVIKRRKSKLHRVIFYMFFAGLIAPVNYITALQVLKALHLNGTYLGTILTYAALGIPFAAFMYYNFIGTIPTEIDEAAIIDGTNISQLFFQVIFPLLKPVTVTVATLTFISAWNDFVSPLYLLNSSSKWTMVLMVYNYWGVMQQEWGKICAVIVLTLIPILIVYIAMQKHIIAGMTSGAVKG